MTVSRTAHVKKAIKRLCASVIILSIGLVSFALTGTASAQSGIASVYSGKRTASGAQATASGLTAAHRTLPFGTLVRVTNDRTGISVVVRIVDRGPFVEGRVIDVSPAAAQVLGFTGLAQVTLLVVGRD